MTGSLLGGKTGLPAAIARFIGRHYHSQAGSFGKDVIHQPGPEQRNQASFIYLASPRGSSTPTNILASSVFSPLPLHNSWIHPSNCPTRRSCFSIDHHHGVQRSSQLYLQRLCQVLQRRRSRRDAHPRSAQNRFLLLLAFYLLTNFALRPQPQSMSLRHEFRSMTQ